MRSGLFPGYRHVLCCVLSLLAAAGGQAQVTPLNVHAVQPEVWHFAGPQAPGVDAGGDLNLSIPVLTVPGRGLDFTVTFSYRSSIPFGQRSGWIGLGWSFDPGSITRDPEGAGAGRPAGSPVTRGYGVDVFDEPSPPEAQPDAFYLTLPGRGTFEMTQVNTDAFTPALLPPTGRGRFVVHEQQAWRVEGMLTPAGTGLRVGSFVTGRDPLSESAPLVQGSDYRRFLITTEDGTRYLFEQPTLSYFDALMDSPSAGQPAVESREVYVNAWRLVAVFGAGFTGDDTRPPRDGEDGSWIRFEYRPVREASEPEALPTGAARHSKITQTTYLRAIVTPTHRAVFYTDVLQDPGTPLFEARVDSLHQRLTAIRLYSRLGASPLLVEEVTLVQEASLGPLLGSSSSRSGRLGLQEIRFTGSDGRSQRPGYLLHYGFNPPCQASPETERNTTDDLGYFRGELDGDCLHFGTPAVDSVGSHAWSLTSIQYPAGGREVFHYENDRIADERLAYESYRYGDEAAMPFSYHIVDPGTGRVIPGRAWQGGARIRQVDRYDGMGGMAQIRYRYGPGHLSGIPPAFWHRLETDGYQVRLYAPARRGKVSVAYESVREDLPGGGAVVTHYTTPAHPSGQVRPARTVLLTHTWTARPIYECRHADYGCGDFAVIQGDEHRNWGRPYRVEYLDANGRRVREVVRVLTLAPDGAYPVLAGIWDVPGTEEDVVVHYGPLRVEREEVRDYGSGAEPYVTRVTEYAYHARTGLPQRVVEYGSGVSRSAVTTYAFEVGAYADAFRARNLLSQVALEHRYQQDARSGAVHHQAVATRWRRPPGLQGDLLPFWKPWQTLRWRSEDPAQAPPAFTAWTTPEVPPGWIAASTHDAYDAHGNLLRETDGRGIVTRFFYDGLQNAYLSGVQRGGLSAAVGYDATFARVNAITDAAGNRRTFDYDAFGRLSTVRNASGQPVVAYAYAYSGGAASPWAFDPSRPNQVRTTTYLDDGRQALRYTYSDGLGRAIQVQQQEAGGQYVVTTSRYDPLGRLWKSWKPYRDRTEGSYRAQDSARVAQHYAPCLAPYQERRYAQDPLARVVHLALEHCGSPGVVRYAYGVEGGHHATVVTDENGHQTKTLVDALGQTVGRIDGLGAAEAAVTRFQYGAPGKVTKVLPPNHAQPPAGSAPEGWAISYRYNSLGQLTSRATPDAGMVLYRYDRGGNVRFIEDAALRADPKRGFAYRKYDAHDRLVESGVYAGSVLFGQAADRADEAAWPTEGTVEVIRYTYDAYEAATAHPPGVQPGNTRGRLTQVRFDGGWYRYYYDREGRIEHLHVYLEGLGEKRVAYAYDRQGNVVQVRYQEGGSDAFYTWHRYDEAGPLREVRSHVRDRFDEAVVEAVYRYEATGQVRQVQLGAGVPTGGTPGRPAQSIDYAYHVRGWLTRINDLNDLSDPSALAGDRFAMQLGYDAPGEITALAGFTPRYNGNVTWAAWQADCSTCAPGVAAMPVGGYVFGYDARDRLLAADFGYRARSGSPWQTTGSFDLGVGQPIRYDPNGNIELLRRGDEDGAANAVTYGYAGSNRLQSIRQTVNGGVEEPFAYDANGNLVQGGALRAIRYDARDLPLQMTRASDGRTFLYRYDADGQRIAKGAEGTMDTFYVRGVDGGVLAVYDAAGRILHWNIRAGGSIIGRAVRAASGPE